MLGMVHSNHAHHFFEKRVRVYLAGLVMLSLTLAAFPVAVAAQTPTPPAWPTPIATDNYIIRQEVSYGEGGIVVGLLFLSGLWLLDLGIRLAERLSDK